MGRGKLYEDDTRRIHRRWAQNSGARLMRRPILRKIQTLIWALIRLTSLSPALAADITWTSLSSRNGDLPVPGESTQQTGNLVADLDRDGVKDFVISFRAKAPALV